MTVTINGTTGIDTPGVVVNSNTISAVNSMGFRNRIINGDMRIDQRNAGAAVTVNTAAGVYTLDRWLGRTPNSAGAFTVQRSTTAPTGFRNSLLCTVTTASTPAASDIYFLQQRIEGFNVADLMLGTATAQTFTVSFWVRSSVTGIFGASVGNNVDQSYPFSFTINAANTFEQKTITIPGSTSGTWDTSNGPGLILSFSLGAGSSVVGTANTWGNYPYAPTGSVNLIATNGATFYITGVQLEAGTVASPFERRDYGRELIMCQRYYYKIFPQAVNSIFGSGYVGSATTGSISNSFPVTMRAAPTALEQSGTASNYRIASGSGTGNCSAVPTFSVPTNEYGFVVTFTVASGLTIGYGMQGRTGDTTGASGYLAWSAEL